MAYCLCARGVASFSRSSPLQWLADDALSVAGAWEKVLPLCHLRPCTDARVISPEAAWAWISHTGSFHDCRRAFTGFLMAFSASADASVSCSLSCWLCPYLQPGQRDSKWTTPWTLPIWTAQRPRGQEAYFTALPQWPQLCLELLYSHMVLWARIPARLCLVVFPGARSRREGC